MTSRLSIRPGAARDIAKARDWYESQQEGLGSRFLDEIGVVLERIGSSPLHFAIVHADARRALMRRFPYAVNFRLRGDEARILAVMHQSRDPRVWQRRVRS